MSEREKRLLKRQQAQLEMEKEELRKEMEKQRKLIEALEDERRKEESKTEDVGKDLIRTSHLTNVDRLVEGIEQPHIPKRASGGKEERIAPGDISLTEPSKAEYKIVDEVGESTDTRTDFVSPDKHKDPTTKQKEVTLSQVDLDFETRYRKLKQSLTDSLERTRTLSKAREKQVDRAKVTDSLDKRYRDNEDEHSLSLTPYLNRNRRGKEEIEDKESVNKQLSTGSVEDSHSEIFLPADLDVEERKLVDHIRKLVRRKNIGGRK